MDTFFRLLGVVMVGVFAGAVTGEGFRVAAAVFAGVLGCMLALELLRPVIDSAERLAELTGVGSAVFEPVFKATAISLLTELAAAFCRENGEAALARTISLGGTVAVLFVSLPLLSALVELLERMLGGKG